MGSKPAAEIDAWLQAGGLLVTASERAARAREAAFHRARRAEGLAAWPAPDVQPWNTFARTAWQARAVDGRLILNAAQEQALWAEMVAAGGEEAALLEGPRHRMARLAMDAHALLCAYAPRLLSAKARAAWQHDAAAFSGWLAAFDDACRVQNLISPSRLPVELLPLLEDSAFGAGRAHRPPLLLAGFDRIQPAQRALFDAWGEWTEADPSSGAGAPEPALSLPKACPELVEGGPDSGIWDGPKLAPHPNEPAAAIHFYQAADPQSELDACALWCSRCLAERLDARLLVVTQEAMLQRGEIERAFLRHANAPFEFSLGIPLSQVALAKSAQLLLRWLTTPLTETELDWLFAAGYLASAQETAALQAVLRSVRRRGLEQPEWPLEVFLRQGAAAAPLPAPWVSRIGQTQRRLAEHGWPPQSPLDWAEFAPQLLQTAGWPGTRPLSSAEYQAARRFQQAVEVAGSLGFDGRRIPWQEFLSDLGRALDETLFAPESRDAPIQIVGPAESAGLAADAIWFLGAHEDAWPAAASTHPLLPPEVQRRYAMPHATAQLDWELARTITARLLASAPEVHFSYARQMGDVEARPSRLIAFFAGPPQPLPFHLASPPIPTPLTVPCEDASLIAFRAGRVEGGAAVLTAQSQCPFKAFATARLGAQTWEPAQTALTPAQRGKLLHAVLHGIWGGEKTGGIRTLAQLQALADHRAFVAAHVRRAMETLPTHLRARLPRRYLELEEQRLGGLITEWLDYESARASFEVAETEAKRTVDLAGLTLDLRLDRIDRLNDGTLLVIDYKTGNVSPKLWDLPRPDDVQLPLYAGFALEPGAELGGLAFAKVRPGGLSFAGRIGDAQTTLLPDLAAGSDLVRNPFRAEQLIDWRDCIEALARDFLAGRAQVDPRDPPKTCQRCGLHTLCRIHEDPFHAEDEDAAEAEFAEAADE